MNKLTSSLAAAGAILAIAAPALAANKTVKVVDDAFKARTVTINKGNVVTWQWAGRNPHNVKFGSFASKVKASGTFKHRFTRRGTYRYRCTIHSGMTGTVVVR